MTKLFQRLGVVVAIVLVALGVGATAASANWDNCPAGDRVCTYLNNDGGAPNYNYSYWLNHCYDIGGVWNDNIHSLINKSGSHWVMFYYDAGCSNSALTRKVYPPGYGESGAGRLQYSSLQWVS